jgi:hypothetical protein
MKKQTDPRSPFLWQGKASIFVRGDWKSNHDFNGTNAQRSAAQSRLEPRPLYLVADSVYLKQPEIGK